MGQRNQGYGLAYHKEEDVMAAGKSQASCYPQ